MDGVGSLRTTALLGGPLALWSLACGGTNAAAELKLSTASKILPRGMIDKTALELLLAGVSGFFA